MLPIIIGGILQSVLPEIIKAIAAAPQQSPDQAAITAKEITKQVIDTVKQAPAVQAGKPLYKAKAVWLGLAQAMLIPGLMYAAGIDWSQHMPIYAATIVSGLLTVAVRMVTTQPVRL